MTNNIAINNDPVLTELFLGYAPKETDYIQDMILPKIPVKSKRGQIRTAGAKAQEYLRINNDVVLGKTKSPEITFSVSKTNIYSTDRHQLKIGITKDEGMEADPTNWRAGMDYERMLATQRLAIARKIGREYALASTLFNTGTTTYDTTLAGADQWSDYVNSDPGSDVQTGIDSVFNYCGVEANTGITSYLVMSKLKNHPLLKRTNGVTPDGTVPVRRLTEAEVAIALGLDRILVGRAKYETAQLGQTSSLANVWGKYFMVAYINPNPNPNDMEKSLGYSFVLDAPVVDWWEEVDPKYVQYVRYDEEYDDVLVDEKCSYLIAGAIA